MKGKKIIPQHFSFNAIKSKGLLNAAFQFVYSLYFLYWDTFMAQTSTEPPASFPFVESKQANPIIFIVSLSSSVLPSTSSSVIWHSLIFVSFVYFFSSSVLSFSQGGEGDVDLCSLGNLRIFCASKESGSSDLPPGTRIFLSVWALPPGMWAGPPVTHSERSSHNSQVCSSPGCTSPLPSYISFWLTDCAPSLLFYDMYIFQVFLSIGSAILSPGIFYTKEAILQKHKVYAQWFPSHGVYYLLQLKK